MEHHKHLVHGTFALVGSLASWFGDHGHDAIANFAFYGGAFVVLLSLVSWCMTIWKQWKHRKD